jgi:hypothetical protein
MTGTKRYALLTATALWVTLVLCSCIKDDLYECLSPMPGPPNPEVFTLLIGFENVKPEYAAGVSRMDVFIFDAEGMFYEGLTERNMSLTPGFQMQTQLPPGNYRLVGWSNLGRHYLTRPAVLEAGVTSYDEAVAMLDMAGGSIIGYDLDTFLHGKKQAVVNPEGETRIMIPLVQNNYRINVTVEGVENNHNYTVAIADNNGSYSFDNDFAPSAALQYTRGSDSDPAGRFGVSLSVLRLDRGRSPELTITDNTGRNTLLRENLIGLLLSLEAKAGVSVDFSTQHEFDIHIIYDQATLSATFFIDGWQIKTSSPGELH